jgi:tRNA dimethylallyltransferase
MTVPDGASADAVLIMGPTGTGKSELALTLAHEFPLEIVSVDSALVYRGLDIGTAKPTAAERALIPHHLIDVCDPAEPYSAGRFLDDTLELIPAIRRRGRIPLLVGGTMLYFRALMRGLATLPPADSALRARLDARARDTGWPALHAELARVDPGAAARIHPADGQRIQRALEVFELTGETISDRQRRVTGTGLRLSAHALMTFTRDELYQRLDRRFDAMLATGLVEEVRTLYRRGDLTPELPSLRSVGYRQLWAHLEGRVTMTEAVAAAKRATRNLAKRQLTWLRSEPAIPWIVGLEDQQLAPIKSVLCDAATRSGTETLC